MRGGPSSAARSASASPRPASTRATWRSGRTPSATGCRTRASSARRRGGTIDRLERDGSSLHPHATALP